MAPRAALMAARAAVTPRAVARAVGALLVCMALKVLAEEPSILKLQEQGKGPVVILRMMMLCSIDFTSQYEREKARGFSHTHLPDPRDRIEKSHVPAYFFSIISTYAQFRFRVSSAGRAGRVRPLKKLRELSGLARTTESLHTFHTHSFTFTPDVLPRRHVLR
jgi:hypothetical protein